jgi:hypothetical protein
LLNVVLSERFQLIKRNPSVPKGSAIVAIVFGISQCRDFRFFYILC